jgi:hypothetical protein
MVIDAQIIREAGKPKFAVLSIEQFDAIQQSLGDFDNLEDFVDYMHAQKVRQETTKWFKLEEVKKQLDL